MPRLPRYELVDLPQHVIQRGNNRQRIFFSGRDYELYLDCLRRACGRHSCDLHAYVLMTNHVHLLVTPRRPLAIARVMQSIGRRYVRCVNDSRGRSGTLWEGRYKASLVDTEAYLLSCYRYIETNPVRAGMVGDPRDYVWSSYERNAWGQSNPMLVDHPAYAGLGRTADERRAAYRQMLRADLEPEALNLIRHAVNHCRPLGSRKFQEEIEAVLKRRILPGKRGPKFRKVLEESAQLQGPRRPPAFRL